MEINSIKMSKDETEIIFTEASGTQTLTTTIVDATTPAPEFVNAFGKLKTLANEVLNGLLKSEAFKKVKPIRIKFKENDKGAIGCIVTMSAEIETSQRPFHFNTPLKFCLAEGQEESEFFLSGKSADLLAELQQFAKDFMNGVRAQGDLFNATEPEAAPAAAPETAVDNGKPAKLRKNRKTCYDCNKASSMVIDGIGYCDEHGQAKLAQEE